MSDEKRHAPATLRNREPILAVLKELLSGAEGRLVEVAAGTGEHAAYLAPHFPALQWQPTDAAPDSLPSIDAWAADAPAPAPLPAVQLDVRQRPWPHRDLAAIFACNLIHISPWAATLDLLAEAALALKPGGLLVLYGPYTLGGVHTAPSNADFDASLRSRDPTWGVRDLVAVLQVAEASGLRAERIAPMPANNLVLALRLPAE